MSGGPCFEALAGHAERNLGIDAPGHARSRTLAGTLATYETNRASSDRRDLAHHLEIETLKSW